MPVISKSDVYPRFKTQAINSSHFVCLLADLIFYETKEGWVFGFTKKMGVTLLALEPLHSDLKGEWNEEKQKRFLEAWREFCENIQPGIVAFVAVYSPFVKILRAEGFQSLKIGHEPWMDLKDCIPTGNAGKGVRNARNQAIHSHVTVEEWPGSSLIDPAQRGAVLALYHAWKASRPVNLGGFLNATDPFAFNECRRYFVARIQDHTLCGYLIATPVVGRDGYFLEDLILSSAAPRGTGELLTLEALVRLREGGFQTASLGVVSATTIESKDVFGLPPVIAVLTLGLPRVLTKLYNFGGLETFRKRFKPQHWEEIHLAVKDVRESASGKTKSSAWLLTLVALFLAFEPRLQFSVWWIANIVIRFIRKYPVTTLVGGVSFALFWGVNHFGSLPSEALEAFGFSAAAPQHEWVVRSLVSDYLYFDRLHFWLWGTCYFAVIAWAERCHKTRFLLPFVALTSLLDDFINYAAVIAPFEYFQPSLFKHLVSYKDVGGSLGLVTLLGLQLCQFRKGREVLFSILSLGLVFGFVFQAIQFQQLVLNLNHFLFLTLGFIAGKLKFEWGRMISRKASKGKPPQAITVALPTQKEKRKEAA